MILGGGLLCGRLLSDLYVELLWHRSTGYSGVFYRRLAWLWGGRLLWGTVVVAALVANLRLVSRTLGGIQIKRRFGNLEISEQLPRAYVWWGVLTVSVMLGLWFGATLPERVAWAAQVALQSAAWGLVDPVLGRDASFYVFMLPLLRTGIAHLMVLIFLVFTLSVGAYAATGAVRWGRGGIIMGEQPRIHLGALVAVFLVVLAFRFHVSRYVLLLAGSSQVQGIFGYADAQARLPALHTMSLVTLVAAGLLMWGVWKNRLLPVVGSGAAVVLGSLLIVQFYPSLVQRFQVEPNELERETPFIEHNLAFTREGFDLSGMTRQRFEYNPEEEVDWAEVRRQFEGLPLWSAGALRTVFQERESRYPYYEFRRVDLTRYPTGDGATVPVALSVREILPPGIPDQAWQNLHLRELYVRGLGAVAVAAAERTAQGTAPVYLGGIPPTFSGGPEAPQALRLTRPEVFFGTLEQLSYAIVNPAVPEEGDTSGAASPGRALPEGVPLDSPLRKLAFAWRFRDANLLLTSELTDSSRIVIRRSVRERVTAIAPFFRYLEAPYPVIADGRVFWVLEGFTTTSGFPLASTRDVSQDLGVRYLASYVRNSVKVTVDAVTGDTRFYAVPGPDPLRDALGRAFPGLLRPLEELPEALASHLRYSRTLFDIQAAVLLQYHQETAPRFHGQQDMWARATQALEIANDVPYVPEYGIYRLPGEDEPTFNLTTAFVPADRQNLTGILVGRLDGEGTPTLALFDVPADDQARGPRQVEVLAEQDPEISRQFSLWRTGGSQVRTGHLHIVPVGARLFYLEPVFLAATDGAIPELQRLVVSDGQRVTLQPSIELAVAALAGDDVPLAPDTEGDPDLPATGVWSRDALDLFREAETRLREGDWQGFGEAFEELRLLLETMAGQGAPAPVP